MKLATELKKKITYLEKAKFLHSRTHENIF